MCEVIMESMIVTQGLANPSTKMQIFLPPPLLELNINEVHFPIDQDFGNHPHFTIVGVDENQNKQLNLQPYPRDIIPINFSTLPGLKVAYIFHQGCYPNTANWEPYVPYNGRSTKVPMIHIFLVGGDKE